VTAKKRCDTDPPFCPTEPLTAAGAIVSLGIGPLAVGSHVPVARSQTSSPLQAAQPSEVQEPDAGTQTSTSVPSSAVIEFATRPSAQSLLAPGAQKSSPPI